MLKAHQPKTDESDDMTPEEMKYSLSLNNEPYRKYNSRGGWFMSTPLTDYIDLKNFEDANQKHWGQPSNKPNE